MGLGLRLALFFAWGFVNMVLMSKAAEYRTDLDVQRDGGVGSDIQSISARLNAANYLPEGQRWRRAFTISWALWLIYACIGLFPGLLRTTAA